MAEDPDNHRFWFPAHEAGHAVVAIDAGLIPAFIRQDFSPLIQSGRRLSWKAVLYPWS